MFIVQIAPVGPVDFYINYPKVGLLELTLSQSHLLGENAAHFSPAVAIHTVLIFVPPSTPYCWVDTGGVDSKSLYT